MSEVMELPDADDLICENIQLKERCKMLQDRIKHLEGKIKRLRGIIEAIDLWCDQ